MDDGERVLCWKAPRGKGWKNEATRYVVYRFAHGEKVDISDASKIVRITSDCLYIIPSGQQGRYTYVVTALDRMQNESKGKKTKIR